MSQQSYWPNRKGQRKIIHGLSVLLGRAWDLTHGAGWFAQVHDNVHTQRSFASGFGFHKTNKFTAVRMAIKEMNKERGEYLYRLRG